MNYLSPIGTFLWDNFDLILFGCLALLALEELNSGFSMAELARKSRKTTVKTGAGLAPQDAADAEPAKPKDGEVPLPVSAKHEWAN